MYFENTVEVQNSIPMIPPSFYPFNNNLVKLQKKMSNIAVVVAVRLHICTHTQLTD